MLLSANSPDASANSMAKKAPSQSDWAISVTTHKSPSGIPFWLVSDKTLPVIALSFTFRGGAAEDDAAKTGTTSLMAQLLTQGAGDMNAENFNNALDEKGIELNISSSLDSLTGQLRTLSSNAPEAFRLLGLALNAPRFDADAVEHVKSAQLARILRDEQDPERVAMRALFAKAYGTHPYARPSAGTRESLSAIKRDDLITRTKAALNRQDLSLTLVGDVDAKTAGALLDQAFATLPKTPQKSVKPTTNPPLNLAKTEVETRDLPQSTVRMLLPSLSFSDPDFVTASLVNHILGGGTFSSRLFKNVREERGLAYGVWSEMFPLALSPIWMAGVATRNDRTAQSLDVIGEEMARMGREGPTEEELKSAKAFLIGSWPLRFDASTKIASELNQFQFLGLGPDYLATRNARLQAITLEEARRVAKKLFDGQKPLIVIIGNPSLSKE